MLFTLCQVSSRYSVLGGLDAAPLVMPPLHHLYGSCTLYVQKRKRKATHTEWGMRFVSVVVCIYNVIRCSVFCLFSSWGNLPLQRYVWEPVLCPRTALYPWVTVRTTKKKLKKTLMRTYALLKHKTTRYSNTYRMYVYAYIQHEYDTRYARMTLFLYAYDVPSIQYPTIQFPISTSPLKFSHVFYVYSIPGINKSIWKISCDNMYQVLGTRVGYGIEVSIYRNIEVSIYRNVEFSIYITRYIEIASVFALHLRVIYAAIFRRLRCIYQIEIAHMD